MTIAFLLADRSHDEETQHGAVIVDQIHRVISVGYNGLPRGGDESVYPTKRPEKYPYMAHAEMNAIVNARCDLAGMTLYVTGIPCPRCFTAIINSGIKTVIFGPRQSNMIGSDEHGGVAMMANNHGVELKEYSGRVIGCEMSWKQE